MAKKNSTLIYKHFWNNHEINESDKDYQAKLEPFSLRYSNDINLFSFINCKVLQKFGKGKGTSPYYINLKSIKTNKIINFYVGYVKNAGMATQDKRLQVSPNIPNFNDQQPYYALGFLPTGDDELIVLVEMKDYVKNKIKSTTKNNSSLWIYYDNLSSAYFDRKLVIQQDHDKKRYIFRRSQNDIMEKVFNSIFGESNLDEEKIEPAKVGELNVSSTVKISRNNSLRDEVLKRANYTCELCKKTNTFQDKDKRWYFEAHHIIPFNINNQKQFNLTLDHLSNLICLCPECHRKVHFSELKEQIYVLEFLLNKKPLLQKYYQVNTVSELLNFYKGEIE
jgi:5-methylcytosine-specific restriction protein A